MGETLASGTVTPVAAQAGCVPGGGLVVGICGALEQVRLGACQMACPLERLACLLGELGELVPASCEPTGTARRCRGAVG